MKPVHLLELVALAAIWGTSFLFLRLSVGEFGPIALAFVRTAGAAVLLAVLVIAGGLAAHWRQHRVAFLLIGVSSAALPFLFFSYAAQFLTGGLMSVFNASTPLFGAAVAWAWLGDRPNASRLVGLAIGFVGVAWLAWDKASFKADAGGVQTGLAVLACLAATFCYALAANGAKRYLSKVPPLAAAGASVICSSFVLAIPAAVAWPATSPGVMAWGPALALALLCTGLAYVMYYRLIGSIGPANAMSVTFLIPVFAMLWGWLALGEIVTVTMVIGCLVILLGTSLATGLWSLPVRAAVQQSPAARE